MSAETFAAIQEYARVARDVIVILGIPALFAVGKWLYNQRISSLNDQIALLEQQVEQGKTLRFDNAWTVIEGQKAVYQTEIEQKEKQIKALGMEHGKKDEEIKGLQDEISGLRQKTLALENARAAITEGDEREEVISGWEIMMRIFRFFGEAAIRRAYLKAPSASTEGTDSEAT